MKYENTGKRIGAMEFFDRFVALCKNLMHCWEVPAQGGKYNALAFEMYHGVSQFQRAVFFPRIKIENFTWQITIWGCNLHAYRLTPVEEKQLAEFGRFDSGYWVIVLRPSVDGKIGFGELDVVVEQASSTSILSGDVAEVLLQFCAKMGLCVKFE